MIRRRRVARRAIAATGLVVFPLVIALSFRRPGTRTRETGGAVAETLLAEATGVRDKLRFEQFEYRESEGDREVYRLRAAEAIAFAEAGEQVFRLKDVLFLSRDPSGVRSAILTAPRAEFVQNTKAFRVFDGVRIDGEGARVTSEAFRYEPGEKLFVSEGPVRALRGALVATARSGSLGAASGVVSLREQVRLRGTDDAGRRLDLAAEGVELSRDGALAARGGVVLKSDALTLRSERLDRVAEPAGDRLEADGNVLAFVWPPEGSKEPAAPVAGAGNRLELRRAPDGAPVSLTLEARPGERSRILGAPSPEAGARRAVTRVVNVTFSAGRLSGLEAPEAIDADEAPLPGRAPGLRTLRAGAGRVAFEDDGRTVRTAFFEGSVFAADGPRAEATAPVASFRGADRSLVLTGSPAAPATYRDARSRILGDSLSYFLADERVEASGHVRATYQGGAEAGFLGGKEASNAPTFSESDFLRAFVRERQLLLTGNVRAWQGENVLRARSLALDDAARTLRAEGDVSVVLRRRKPGLEGKGSIETLTATGDVLTHREDERLVRMEGKATVVSGTFVIKADVTDFHLGPDRTLESAEARGGVVLEDRALSRRGDGTRASWLPQADSISLEGSPATALDGKGNKVSGAVLTFHQGRSRIDVETRPGVPSEGVLRPEGSS